MDSPGRRRTGRTGKVLAGKGRSFGSEVRTDLFKTRFWKRSRYGTFVPPTYCVHKWQTWNFLAALAALRFGWRQSAENWATARTKHDDKGWRRE